jgi:hypothetical protein
MGAAPSREAGCTAAPSGDGACERQPAARGDTSWPPPVEVVREQLADGNRDIIVSPRCSSGKSLSGVLTAASSLLFGTATALAWGLNVAGAFGVASATARPTRMRPPRLAVPAASAGSAADAFVKRPPGGILHRLGWLALAAAAVGVGSAVARSRTARDNAVRSLRPTSLMDCHPESPGAFLFVYVLILPVMLLAEAGHALYSMADVACTVGALTLPVGLAFTAAHQAVVWPGPVARLGGAALWRWATLGAPSTVWAEIGVAGAAVKLGSLFVPPPTRTLPPPSRFWRWMQEQEVTDETARTRR